MCSDRLDQSQSVNEICSDRWDMSQSCQWNV